eukprot:COSAG05_NODE_1082_length_5937_cov_2.133265_6_plen_222_part_00
MRRISHLCAARARASRPSGTVTGTMGQALRVLLVLFLSAHRYRPVPAAGTGTVVVPGDIRLYGADPLSPPLPPAAACVGIDIRRYGAVPDDGHDDTAAIQHALDHCHEGGAVCVPAGEYTISLPNTTAQRQVDLCLAIPSDCTLRGVGPASVLKYADEVNVNGWWRMLGPLLQVPTSGDGSHTAATAGSAGSHSNNVFTRTETRGSAHNISITDQTLNPKP